MTAHLANSAGALRFPERASTPSAAALRSTGCRPSATTPRPTDSSRRSAGGATSRSCASSGRASTGYGRRFVAEGPARVGIVPWAADGFRRGLTGTEVLVDGVRRRVVGTVSMDAFAVELEGEQAGADVTLIGDGILAEDHARVLGTINYELTCGLNREPTGPTGASSMDERIRAAIGDSRRGLSAARCRTSCSAGARGRRRRLPRIPSWPRASTRG